MLLEVSLYLNDSEGYPQHWRIQYHLDDTNATIYGPDKTYMMSMKFNSHMWTLADAQDYLDSFLRLFAERPNNVAAVAVS